MPVRKRRRQRCPEVFTSEQSRLPGGPTVDRRAADPACQHWSALRRQRLRERSLMTTMNGTIKRMTDRGFGFIATTDGTDYFFHQSACVRTRFEELREGQRV